MKITKILETRVNLSNINDIYSNNLNKVIIDTLEKKYVGICYKSCYIIKINKIIRRSLAKISVDLEGTVNIDVVFEVTCVVYNKKEIITKVEIINKDPSGRIQGKSKYCNLEILPDPLLTYFKKGDMICVNIIIIRYLPGKKYMSGIANLLKPRMENFDYTIYLNKNKKNAEDEKKIKILFDKKKEQENISLKNNNEKMTKYFNNLLYINQKEKHLLDHFKNIKKLGIKIDEIKLEEKEIMEYNEGIYIFNENTKIKEYIYFIKLKDEQTTNKIIKYFEKYYQIAEYEKIAIIENFLNELLIYKNSVNELISNFKDIKDIDKNTKKIFDYYALNKNNLKFNI